MKKILILVAATFVCSFCFAQSKDADEIKKLNAEWIASYVTSDTATLSRIWADDIVLTNPAGKAVEKKDMLNNVVKPGHDEYISTRVDTASVRLFGNIGIINAEVTGVVKAGDKTATVRVGYMDVYEKRKGRWYAIAAHVTLLSGN
ncbi:MAG TPA: nuclear transport factor 2 family protein [Mucilaginibacter sp.]|jgi:uncharacterized protein (TIGR02246 family)|nr:nuclear transport factor 2 family protein [Mucilaginibacter sp.]